MGGQSTVPAHMESLGYVQIAATGLASAAGLGTIPNHAVMAVIQPTAQNVRYRDDGTNPTASAGMRLVANDVLFYTGDLSAIKFIEEAASAVLNITFYK